MALMGVLTDCSMEPIFLLDLTKQLSIHLYPYVPSFELAGHGVPRVSQELTSETFSMEKMSFSPSKELRSEPKIKISEQPQHPEFKCPAPLFHHVAARDVAQLCKSTSKELQAQGNGLTPPAVSYFICKTW